MGDIDFAQIRKDVAGFRGRFGWRPESSSDIYAEGEMSLTYTSDGSDEPEQIAAEIQGEHIAVPIARMLNAVPLLLAEVERLRQRLAEANRRLAEARQEIADVRGMLDAHGHDGIFEAAAKLRAEVAQLRGACEPSKRPSFMELLAWRGVIDPCVRCGGAGQIQYGRSCTWRGGMAVSGDYRDVCDLCWGTGDRWRHGVDLRQLRDEESARIAAAALTAVAAAAGVTLHPAGARAFAAKVRELVQPTGRKRPAIEGDLAALMLSIARLIESAASAPQSASPAALRPSERT